MSADDCSDFGVRVMRVEDLTVVALTGEWDVLARDTLHDVLLTTEPATDIVIDARAASFFDSSALSQFVSFFKRVTERGRRFELLAGGSNILRLLEITNLDEVLLPPPERKAFLEEHIPYAGNGLTR